MVLVSAYTMFPGHDVCEIPASSCHAHPLFALFPVKQSSLREWAHGGHATLTPSVDHYVSDEIAQDTNVASRKLCIAP